MTRFLNILFTLAKYVVIFLIGLITGFFLYTYVVNRFSLGFNNEIDFSLNPFDIVSLVVNTLLAVYVLRNLNRKDESKKTECNLIINYISSFDTDFNKAIVRHSKNDVKFEDVTAIFKTYGIRLEKLFRLAVEQKFIKNDSSSKKKILEDTKLIKELMTNTPKDGAVEDGIRISSGKLSFSDTQQEKITNALFSIHNSIFCLITEVNRSTRM